LCRNAGIKRFHHVSTAYVCGLRQGLILESEVDVGQQLSNDYERSKLTSEKAVRAADFLEQVTVYRPAIIIGDSSNGHTTTYHGFYAPIQAVSAISQAVDRNETGLRHDSARFPLSGHETKNLVPVDWVSAVMAHVFSHPEHHGQTYHLTPQHPVTARLLAETVEETIGFYSVQLEGGGRQIAGLTEYEQLFAELIRVYASYWKDDPVFDTTNTRRAAPHLPCPHVNRKMLQMLARYAISINFTSPRDRPTTPRFDTANWLADLCEAEPGPGRVSGESQIGLRITGHGGGDWTLTLSGGRAIAAAVGMRQNEAAIIECDVDTLASIADRRCTPADQIAHGSVLLKGTAITANSASRVLTGLVDRQAAAAQEPARA